MKTSDNATGKRGLSLRSLQRFVIGALLALLAACCVREGATIVSSSPAELMRLAQQKLGRRPSTLASRQGQRHTRISRKRVRRRKQRRYQRRAEHRRVVKSTPKPRTNKTAGLTVKVLDGKGRPVPHITMAAVVHNNSGPDVKASKVTDGNGNMVLEKVGPLPAAVELDSASPRWRLADVDSSSYLIQPAAGAMSYETAKVRPATLALKVQGAAGTKITTAALAPPPAGDAEDEDESDNGDDDEDEKDAAATEAAPAVESAGDEQVVELPSANLQDGAVPIVLSKDLPGGAAESIVYDYDEDAEDDTINAPTPRLASVKSVAINGGIGVLSTDDQVEKALGKRPKDNPKKNLNLIFDEKDGLTDGSEWWVYPKFGLAVKERPAQRDKDLHLTERIRLLAPGGGDISGIKVGSTVEELRAQLGDPQVADAPPIPADRFAPKTAHVDSYLDDGLRFGHDGQKVVWIDIARPTELLEKGTISFAPGERARVFVKEFKPWSGASPRLNMSSEEGFKNYLRRLPSIEVVDSPDDADLLLSARVTNFTFDKDQAFGSVIPYEYSCQTTLQYDLQDVATGKYIAQNKTVTGESKASFRKEIYEAIAAAVGLKVIVGGNLGDYGPWVIGGALIYDLKHKMQKAANRCPGISERQVFDNLTQQINGDVDYRAQVTDIDYRSGRITLDVGSRDGVHASTAGQPFEFEISAADVPLLDKSEDGRDADYYTAVVREVRDDSCVCELRHVKGTVKAGDAEIPSEPALDVVRTLPDPATGVLSARAWTRFAPVEVISDEDIKRSDELEAQKRTQWQAQPQAPVDVPKKPKWKPKWLP